MAKSHAHAARFRTVLRLFQLFGHPIRTIMFQRLARTPMSAGELARSLPVSRTAIVQHLKLMQAARLVDARAEGRRRVYFIQPEALQPLKDWLAAQAGDPPPA